jgi:hypothetical protein
MLKILLPYLYRDLRVNKGVIDQVIVCTVMCPPADLVKLKLFANAVNEIFHQEIFRFEHLGRAAYDPQKKSYFSAPSFMIWREPHFIFVPIAMSNPSVNFVKLDDDVVYVHPTAMRNLFGMRNATNCSSYVANTVNHVTTNVIHQDMGIYDDDELNPRKLFFKDNKGKPVQCGYFWRSCASLTLTTFLKNYKEGKLDKYMWNHNRALDFGRIGINAYSFDHTSFERDALRASAFNVMFLTDEHWLTLVYSYSAKRPHCINGQSLMVHFSYGSTHKYLTDKTDFLDKFECIVHDEIGKSMPQNLWDIVDKNI